MADRVLHRRRRPWWPALCVGVLALALALRALAAPGIAPASQTGLVALCLGGQIVYVALDGYEGPTEPFEAPAPDPCPWLGFGPQALAPGPAALPGSPPRIDLPIERLLASAAADRARAYSPRAPPGRG